MFFHRIWFQGPPYSVVLEAEQQTEMLRLARVMIYVTIEIDGSELMRRLILVMTYHGLRCPYHHFVFHMNNQIHLAGRFAPESKALVILSNLMDRITFTRANYSRSLEVSASIDTYCKVSDTSLLIHHSVQFDQCGLLRFYHRLKNTEASQPINNCDDDSLPSEHLIESISLVNASQICRSDLRNSFTRSSRAYLVHEVIPKLPIPPDLVYCESLAPLFDASDGSCQSTAAIYKQRKFVLSEVPSLIYSSLSRTNSPSLTAVSLVVGLSLDSLAPVQIHLSTLHRRLYWLSSRNRILDPNKDGLHCATAVLLAIPHNLIGSLKRILITRSLGAQDVAAPAAH